MTDATTGVVGQMPDHAAHGRWAPLGDLMKEDVIIVEPASHPYGGAHHGHAGYVALMETIGRLFDLDFRLGSIRALDAGRLLLEIDVTFAARQTGRAVTLSVMERLWIRDGRVARSEVFLSDSAALLATLEPD